MSTDIKSHAEKFAVWRFGELTDWECAHEDISEATGVPVHRVRHICRANGWVCNPIETGVSDVDCYMIPTSSVDVSHFHV